MALAALAPLLGSMAGGSLAASGTLGALGIGATAGGSLLGSALGSGLGTTLATGDLGKGLESGLLGYGLGGAMGAFGGGASPAMDGVMTGANPSAEALAAANGASGAAGSVAPAVLSAAPAAGAGGVLGGMGSGGASMLANLVPAATVATPGLSIAGEALQPAPPTQPTYTSPGLTQYKTRQAATIPTNFRPGISPEMSYFTPSGGYAQGGPIMAATAMNLTPQQIMQQQMVRQANMPNGYANGGSVSGGRNMIDSRGLSFLNHEAMKQAMPMSMGASGTPGGMNPSMGAKLPKFAAGGAPMAAGMQGIADPSMAGDMAVPPVAGDGSSDNIPATIDGKQPALLSSNEHVIDAATVAHLGNGSSAAGHKALKNMVKRVRLAKTGSAAMPPRINPQAMLPA